jgi:hypothetical protein
MHFDSALGDDQRRRDRLVRLPSSDEAQDLKLTGRERLNQRGG